MDSSSVPYVIDDRYFTIFYSKYAYNEFSSFDIEHLVDYCIKKTILADDL